MRDTKPIPIIRGAIDHVWFKHRKHQSNCICCTWSRRIQREANYVSRKKYGVTYISTP